MTFNSRDLSEYLGGDKEKTHNYFSSLKRYILVDTKTCLIQSSRGEVYGCLMYCKTSDALRLAKIKLNSTNKRTNKTMWNDIKTFAEQRISNETI